MECNNKCYGDRHYDTVTKKYYVLDFSELLCCRNDYLFCLDCGYVSNKTHDMALHEDAKHRFQVAYRKFKEMCK